MTPPVYIVTFPPDDPRLGCTDGQAIWLNAALTQTGLRCTYQHELEHYRRGHTQCQPDHVEQHVRATVAKTLIPDWLLTATRQSATSLDDWADTLNVTVDVLTDRLNTLTSTERYDLLYDESQPA